MIGGLSLLLGAVFAADPVLVIVALFLACVIVAVLTTSIRSRLASLVMMLGLPLFGAGLSESPWTAGLAAGGLILTGSVYGWLVSLLWPDQYPVGLQQPADKPRDRRAMTLYGVEIGLAGATAAALGFAFGVDHPGWACTAALMISRPDRHMREARAVGRAVSVTAGTAIACLIVLASTDNVILATVLILTLAAGSGTAGSRWYNFPFFSTVIVLSMLLLGEPDGPHWFIERVGLTLLGGALVLGFGWLVPTVAQLVASTQRKVS